MSTPMPIELVLAAHDYQCPCIMALSYGCPFMASYVLYIGHGDGTPICGPTPAVPLCQEHKDAAVFAASASALSEILGAEPMPACDECGRTTKILRVTTLRGEEV